LWEQSHEQFVHIFVGFHEFALFYFSRDGVNELTLAFEAVLVEFSFVKAELIIVYSSISMPG